MSEWLATLEATSLAQALRHSVWAYPIVNAAHLLGVALLVGAVIPLDLRLLGVWSSVPLMPLWRVLARTAVAGFVLAATFGSLLFITAASEYVDSGFFLAKMTIVGVATANALVLRTVIDGRLSQPGSTNGSLSPCTRVAAGISLLAWSATLVLGRLVGYF